MLLSGRARREAWKSDYVLNETKARLAAQNRPMMDARSAGTRARAPTRRTRREVSMAANESRAPAAVEDDAVAAPQSADTDAAVAAVLEEMATREGTATTTLEADTSAAKMEMRSVLAAIGPKPRWMIDRGMHAGTRESPTTASWMNALRAMRLAQAARAKVGIPSQPRTDCSTRDMETIMMAE